MEIEQKERERIEADIDAYIKDLWHDVHSPNNNSPKIVEAITHFRAGKQSEHLHFQKEVIQPLRKQYNDLGVKFDKEVERWQERDEKERSIRFKLEAENKALRDLLGEVRRTFGNDTMVVQILPERDSYYTPIWIKKIDQLLTKNEGL